MNKPYVPTMLSFALHMEDIPFLASVPIRDLRQARVQYVNTIQGLVERIQVATQRDVTGLFGVFDLASPSEWDNAALAWQAARADALRVIRAEAVAAKLEWTESLRQFRAVYNNTVADRRALAEALKENAKLRESNQRWQRWGEDTARTFASIHTFAVAPERFINAHELVVDVRPILQARVPRPPAVDAARTQLDGLEQRYAGAANLALQRRIARATPPIQVLQAYEEFVATLTSEAVFGACRRSVPDMNRAAGVGVDRWSATLSAYVDEFVKRYAYDQLTNNPPTPVVRLDLDPRATLRDAWRDLTNTTTAIARGWQTLENETRILTDRIRDETTRIGELSHSSQTAVAILMSYLIPSEQDTANVGRTLADMVIAIPDLAAADRDTLAANIATMIRDHFAAIGTLHGDLPQMQLDTANALYARYMQERGSGVSGYGPRLGGDRAVTDIGLVQTLSHRQQQAALNNGRLQATLGRLMRVFFRRNNLEEADLARLLNEAGDNGNVDHVMNEMIRLATQRSALAGYTVQGARQQNAAAAALRNGVAAPGSGGTGLTGGRKGQSLIVTNYRGMDGLMQRIEYTMPQAPGAPPPPPPPGHMTIQQFHQQADAVLLHITVRIDPAMLDALTNFLRIVAGKVNGSITDALDTQLLFGKSPMGVVLSDEFQVVQSELDFVDVNLLPVPMRERFEALLAQGRRLQFPGGLDEANYYRAQVYWQSRLSTRDGFDSALERFTFPSYGSCIRTAFSLIKTIPGYTEQDVRVYDLITSRIASTNFASLVANTMNYNANVNNVKATAAKSYTMDIINNEHRAFIGFFSKRCRPNPSWAPGGGERFQLVNR